MLDVVALPPAGVRRRAGWRRSASARGCSPCFPFLSIYLQDVVGFSALGAGVAFLPFTAFVFRVPLVTRKFAQRNRCGCCSPSRWPSSRSGSCCSSSSRRPPGTRALLPGFVVSGHRHGLANPTIAGAALRVVDPGPHGDGLLGISNTARITGLAVGGAVLGAILQSRVGSSLRGAGFHGAFAVGGRRARRACAPRTARRRSGTCRADRGSCQRPGHDRPHRCRRPGDRRAGGGAPRAPGRSAEAGSGRRAGDRVRLRPPALGDPRRSRDRIHPLPCTAV